MSPETTWGETFAQSVVNLAPAHVMLPVVALLSMALGVVAGAVHKAVDPSL